MDLLVVLGPLSLEDFSYVALRFDGDRLSQPAVDGTPEGAARRLLAKGAEVALHPHNAELAKALGLPTQEPTEGQKKALGFFAFSFGAGPALQKITDFDLLDALLGALRGLDEVRAWENFDPMWGMGTRIKGALGRWEVMVLGSAGLQRAFVLQPPGNATLMREQPEEASQRLVESTEAIVVFLEEEPAWRAELLRHSHGLSHWPKVVRLSRGRHGVLRPDEARLLVAAIRATNGVALTGEEQTGQCEHRGKRVEVTVEPGGAWREAIRPHPAHDLDRALTEKLLGFAADLPGYTNDWLLEGVLESAPEIAVPVSLYQRPFEGKTIARRAREAGLLDEAEQKWVEAQEGVRTCLVEVEAVASAEVAVHDLQSGEAHTLFDRAIAESVRLRAGLLVRILKWGDNVLAAGTAGRMLPPAQARKLRDTFRAEGGEALAEPERTLELLRHWSATEEEAGPRGVTNTDGEPAAFVVQRFSVREGSIAEGLKKIPGVIAYGGGSFGWTKRGNAMHPTWWRTALGAIQVNGRTIEASTNSLHRADTLRDLLVDVFGDQVASVSRDVKPAPIAPGFSGVVDSQPMPDGPWLALIPQLQTLRRALDLLAEGPTPERVDEIHGELCALEFERDMQPDEDLDEAEPIDLRRIIGIDGRGNWVGPDKDFAAFGAGVPLSTVLPSFVAPLQNELRIEMKDLVELLVRLWNESRAVGSSEEVLERVLEGRKDAAQLREPFEWMLEQMQHTHGWDRRVIRKWSLEGDEKGYQFSASATVDTSELVHLKEQVLGWYGPDEPAPAEVWLNTPAPWRRHLVANFLRDNALSFEFDYDLFLQRIVEIEDALARGAPKILIEAVAALEEEGGERGDSVLEVAGQLVLYPEAKIGTRATAALRTALAELFED